MQHTLQKLAGLAFRGVVRPWPATPPFHKAIPRAYPTAFLFHPRFQTIFTTSSTRNIPSPLSLGEATSDHYEESEPTPETPLTPAAQGRAAASAIRQFIQEENVADAYTIVNSIRYAAFPETPDKLFSVKSMDEFSSAALAFSPDVSPRLPAHSLLHGLVRLGMADKASKLAHDMISAGIRVRCQTIEAIYSGLIHASQIQPAPKELPTHAELKSPDILHLDPSKVLDKRTGFAIRLLGLARQSRQRRSHNMFKLLMTLCVINGEIILASLLFGVLVRDWQARDAQIIEARATPKPSHDHVIDICGLANDYLASPPTSPSAKLQYQTGLQALAILANLLDRQVIEIQNIPGLISSLYHCPRGSAEVWVQGDDENPIRVQAHSFIHGVLERLVDSMWGRTFHQPQPPPNIPADRRDDAITLDRASCNTLLAYALNHRYSIPLAAKVWRYMTDMRFTQDHVTHAILDRAGETLDLTQLRMSDTPIQVRDLTRLRDEGNNYLLDAYLRRVIADGRFGTLMAALPVLLPGFKDVTFGNLLKGRSDAARRTSDYGPVVFSSFLTGLCKAGHYKLAEKLFLWIRIAESHSWRPDDDGIVTPWCIPIQVYTNMIQLYEKMAKLERKYGDQVKSLRQPKPQVHTNMVKLYGKMAESKRNRRDRVKALPQPKPSPREYAMELYRMVKPAARAVERTLSRMEDRGVQVNIENNFLNIPHPDKPFFNAILKFVGRRVKGKQQSTTYYHRQMRRALKDYLDSGHLYRVPLPELVEIAQDIIEAGIPIPLIYRPCLVGRIPTEQFGKSDDDWPGISSIPYSKWKATAKKRFPLQQYLATQAFGPAGASAG